MGVDWYPCNYCGETFPDCGDYVSCSCGKHWCCYECASEEGFDEVEIECEGDYEECDNETCVDEEENKSCSYCRKEIFEDSEVLEFMLSYYSTTREEIIIKMKE